MIDWNALAEKHKLGTTDVERTLTLVCRELAKLVPQEIAEPGTMTVQHVKFPEEFNLEMRDGKPVVRIPGDATIEGEDSASG